jgi:tRNA-splicing ligase RtcB (3'-phosphate/5'-hydroxy nucleic acid ligase)
METERKYNVIEVEGGAPIKAWNQGVPFEDKAIEQLKNAARMPFVGPYVAAMPDTHWGNGATVGSVIPTTGAIMPAAVGVDIGCGMLACRIAHTFSPDIIAPAVRAVIEKVVPAGRTNNGKRGDRGAWTTPHAEIAGVFADEFANPICELTRKHPNAYNKNAPYHLGTLGTGNHFIEVCRDTQDRVWVVLHSGSRGFGNKIGSYFTGVAKKLCEKFHVKLPDPELAFLPEETDEFNDYIDALFLAQRYAWRNRELMMSRILDSLELAADDTVHCHHNYMAVERHFGKQVILTRKGAVNADRDLRVVIPGSMGARTYIARGLGSRDSFHSCSHGAGRAMGRNEARRRFSVEEHIRATEGVDCHKGAEVLDETPGAYKDIDLVMGAQTDLVEPVETLKQLLCVKGIGD